MKIKETYLDNEKKLDLRLANERQESLLKLEELKHELKSL